MSGSLRIQDCAGQILSPTLSDILKRVGEALCLGEKTNFFWSIIWLEAIGYQQGIQAQELEKTIAETPGGLKMPLDEMMKLSDDIEQITNIVVIGSSSEENLTSYKDDADIFMNCEIVIQLVDTSHWEVTSTLEDVLSNLEESFEMTDRQPMPRKLSW